MLRKLAITIGGAVAAFIGAAFLYVWLVLPACTILPRSEVVSPDERFVAVIESRQCSKPEQDRAMVLLRSRDRTEQPVVFELLEANGPIAVQWADWTRLEIRYPIGAKTRQSSQQQGWPTVRYLEVADL
jgi:hypothetical protein